MRIRDMGWLPFFAWGCFRDFKSPGPCASPQKALWDFSQRDTAWGTLRAHSGWFEPPSRRSIMQDTAVAKPQSLAIPFDTDKLDRLMEAAGIDILLATSKHNVQYLLGAERAIFFDYMDALGTSRYLPIMVYPKGAPDQAAFIGHRLETHQRAVAPLWIPEVKTTASGSVDAVARAVEVVRATGVPRKRVGVELAFLPMDAGKALADTLPGSEIKDALFVLERLRAVKTPAELAKLRNASDLVVDAMLEVIAR